MLTPRHTWILGIMLFTAVYLNGCAGTQRDTWPILHSEQIIDAEGRKVKKHEVLYPFIETRRAPDYNYLTIRPLADYESSEDTAVKRLRFLWPLGLFYHQQDRSKLYRFWPVFQHSRTEDFFTGQSTTHGWVFPVIFWGHKPDQGRYGGVLPVLGRTYGLLGDEFSWFLFPLSSRFRQGQYVRYDVLWPFFSYGSIPEGDSQVVRAWPLYVRKSKEESHEHNYLLWPFFRWGKEHWETVGGAQRRRDYAAFHPFYASQTVVDEENEELSRQRQILFYNRHHDNRWDDEEYRRWSAFFSILRRQYTDSVDETRVFPLYWRSKRFLSGSENPEHSVENYRYLWPVFWHTKDRSLPDKERSYSVFAPILWHYSTNYYEEDVTEHRTSLWPLFTLKYGRPNSLSFYILSHGWGEPDSGYKRIYRPFFEFYRYKREPDGSRITRLLWRLYYHERGPEGRKLSVPLLFSYESSLSEETESFQRTFSFLRGLLQYNRDTDGGEFSFFQFY